MDVALDAAATEGRSEVRGLPADWRARLDTHLQACPGCRRQWDVLRAAEAALRVPQPVTPPPGLLLEFRQRLEREAAAPPPRVRPWVWLWPVGSLAAGAAAALAISLNMNAATSERHATRPEQVATTPRFHAPTPLPPVRSADDALRNRAHDAVEDPRRDSPSVATNRASLPPAPPRQRTVRPPAAPRETNIARNNLGVMLRDLLRETPTTGSAADLGTTGSTNPAPEGRAGGGAGGGMSGGMAGAAAGDLPGAALRAPGVPGGRPEAVAAAPLYGERILGLEGVQQKLPPEFEVSPALLTALQREVDVKAEAITIQSAARQLSAVADVPVQVETPARVVVKVPGERAPLWVVLESVARQSNLKIYPEENQLVLRPVGQKEPDPRLELESARGPVRQESPPRSAGNAAARGAAREPKAAAPAPPGVKSRLDLHYYEGQAPDRGVWPSAWGTLPERGFAVPTPAEFVAGALQSQVLPDGSSQPAQYRYQRNAPAGPAGPAGPAASPAPARPAKPRPRSEAAPERAPAPPALRIRPVRLI